MLTVAYVLYASAQAALAAWAIALYRRRRSVGALTLILPIAAVVYDNTMVALGSFIGDGTLLQVLSWPRFFGHALLTPVWIVTAVAFARRTGAFAGREKAASTGSWVLYTVMMAIGMLHSVVLLEYAPVVQGDLFYYTNGGGLGLPGPPIPSFTMVVVAIACGAIVLKRARWPWMLAGSAFMLFAAAVPTELVGFAVSNSGEVIMAASLVMTERFLQRHDAAGLAPAPAAATSGL